MRRGGRAACRPRCGSCAADSERSPDARTPAPPRRVVPCRRRCRRRSPGGSRPRSPNPVSRLVTTVVFSVEPSASPSGCLVPSIPTPSATTQRCSPKCTPSTINATRSSPDRSADSSSASAVSRRFVAATETALAELLSADLSGLDLVALMVDGVHFGDHLCVVALGIGIDGVKHPLGLAEGSTENTTVVTDLLTGLGDRGLDTTRAIFVGIDGGKALRAAVERVFEHPVIQRCQLHKIRNVADKLPDHLASTVTKRMRAAYRADSALAAEAQLEALAKELERTHPGAAGSLREGLAETLTVLRLGVAPTLARTLRSTNSIESMISIARTHSSNVNNWQNGTIALRWCAAGMIAAGKQFRRVNGDLHLPGLRVALDAYVAAQTVGAIRHDEPVIAA